MTELKKVTKEQLENLFKLGYPNGHTEPVPTVALALQWLDENKGIYLNIGPELYMNGINWNWQLLWYKPKDQWKSQKTHNPHPFRIGEVITETYYDNIDEGTFMFGDNNEYPTKSEAEAEALDFAINMLLFGKEYANNHVKPYCLTEE